MTLHPTPRRRAPVAAAAGLLATVLVAALLPLTTSAAGAADDTPSHHCVNSLGAYAGQELSSLGIKLDAPDPSVIEGQPVTLSGTTLTVDVPGDYFLSLYRGRERGNYALLEPGDNTLPVGVWAAIEGANTVEGTQTVFIEWTYSATITDPTPAVDAEGDPIPDTTNWAGRNSGDESADDETIVVNLPNTTWTPTGDGPVTFSEGAPGSISHPVDVEVGTPGPDWEGPAPIPQPEGTVHVDGTSTHNMNINPYWVMPYGSVFLRVDTLSSVLRPETGTNTNGYGSNLDCLPGTYAVNVAGEGETVPGRNAHGAFEPGTELAGWTTKVVDGQAITGPELMVNGGSLGRYTITEAPRAPFATADVFPVGSHECINSLGAYAGQELSYLSTSLTAPDPHSAGGQPATLSGAQLTVEVPGDYFLSLYRGRERGNYALLEPSANTLPVGVWVAIEGANTVEGTQTVHVDTTYTTTITDPTPAIDAEGDPIPDTTNWAGRNSGDESATAATVVVDLPATTWTPTGDGPVTFSEGAPGSISHPVDVEVGTPGPDWEGPAPIPQPEGTVHVDGTSTHNMNINPYWVKPYGSVFLRISTLSSVLRPETGTNTNGYGTNLDCLAGEYTVNTGEDVPGRNAHGAFEPGTELAGWTTKVVDGQAITGPELMVNGGSLGRYTIAEADRAPFAGLVVIPDFPDVPADSQFYDEVSWAVTEGITQGDEAGNFNPTGPVTRQSMAAFLYRYAGSPEFTAPETPSFPDVPTTHVFYKEIEWASAEGIAEGGVDGLYRPTQDIARQAIAALLFRLEGPTFEPPATPTFPDVPTTHLFFEEIEWAASVGVVNGYGDGTFKPGDGATRQVMATMLFRLAHPPVG